MTALALTNITVEVASQDDSFLTDMAHLVLDLNRNGQLVEKIHLFPRKSMPGVWDTDRALVLREVTGEYMLSVSMQFDENDRQLIGSMELKRTELSKKITRRYEIPFLSHDNYPNIILRTKILAVKILREAPRGLIPGATRQISRSNEGDSIEKMAIDGVAAYTEFQTQGKPDRLELAISKYKAVVEATPENDPRFPRHLSNLATFLIARFEQLGRVSDLSDSIKKLEKAAALMPDGLADKAPCLSNLGSALKSKFERFGRVGDIDSAIVHLQAAVDLTPDGHPDKPLYLSNIGNALGARFERLGGVGDMDSAIIRHQAAISLTPDGHPEKPLYLNGLGNTLGIRFRRFGDVSDIDGMIIHFQAAVDLTPDRHPEKLGRLNNLGSAFGERFRRFGDVGDINSAIIHNQAAINLTPDRHPNKPVLLNNLGLIFGLRFDRVGDVGDIDSAIIHLQAAVDLTPDGHPNKPGYLNNLGNTLETRFDRFGDVSDMNSAIIHHQAAVDLTPDRHPDKPGRLNGLGNALETRFRRVGDIGDINQAIIHLQAAVDLTPNGHPNKPGHLNNLGVVLGTRFRRFGDAGDIDSAIIHFQAAVDLTLDDHPRKPHRLHNLGGHLQRRFEQFGDVGDIDRAIVHIQAAVDLIPDGHFQKTISLNHLGGSLMTRFFRFHKVKDAKQAIFYLSASAQSHIGSPIVRFSAAQRWISIGSRIRHKSLLSAYECALELMPLVAWLGLSIPHRHEQLAKIGSIARDAAAAAIAFKQYDRALEWLEQGRSIVWNQILQLRTPVDELRSVDPHLADRLLRISRLLDRGDDQKETMTSKEEEGRRSRALTVEWESTIEQVRSLTGFEDFLKPPRISRLIDACQNGPVVVFNIANQRCDALSLVPGIPEVVHIPLPDITFEKITELRDEFRDMLSANGIRMRGERAAMKVGDDDEIEDCTLIQSDLWNGLVKPVLDSLALSPHPDVLPRIWWCATGPLAFLPIHAAGIYDNQVVGSQISDYVISSYTPTLSSLLQSPDPSKDSPFKLLSVIQPSAPGLASIPNTEEELEFIKAHVLDRDHIILNGQEGTKNRVTKAMKNSNWVHLACHGSQRQDEPTKSALILEDGHLTLEEIIKLDLPNAEFAFLSACQTTTGEETLSDEAVHIAGGMLLAGYRGVVATMWSIQDDVAPEVANEFYRHIMGDGGRPDSRKAAEALHYSIQRLRKKRGIPLTSWIPFVHLGL